MSTTTIGIVSQLLARSRLGEAGQRFDRPATRRILVVGLADSQKPLALADNSYDTIEYADLPQKDASTAADSASPLDCSEPPFGLVVVFPTSPSDIPSVLNAWRHRLSSQAIAVASFPPTERKAWQWRKVSPLLCSAPFWPVAVLFSKEQASEPPALILRFRDEDDLESPCSWVPWGAFSRGTLAKALGLLLNRPQASPYDPPRQECADGLYLLPCNVCEFPALGRTCVALAAHASSLGTSIDFLGSHVEVIDSASPPEGASDRLSFFVSLQSQEAWLPNESDMAQRAGRSAWLLECRTSDFSPAYIVAALTSSPFGNVLSLAPAEEEAHESFFGLLPLLKASTDHQTRITQGLSHHARIEALIKSLELGLAPKRADLWAAASRSRPAASLLNDTAAALADLAVGSRKSWAATLPTPLAHVLRKQEFEQEARSAVRLQLAFFEAALQLHATILVSALSTLAPLPASFYEKAGPRPLEETDFGTWLHLNRHFSSCIRQFRINNAAASAGSLEALFCDRSLLLPRTLASPEMDSIFEEARLCRNIFSHNGFCSDADLRNIQERLTPLLARYQVASADMWRSVRLVTIGTNAKRKGLYRTTCLIHRSTDPALTEDISLHRPAGEEGRLAVHAHSEDSLLELLPLLEAVAPGEADEFFLFYAKFSEGLLRYISFNGSPSKSCEPDYGWLSSDWLHSNVGFSRPNLPTAHAQAHR